MQTEIKDGSEFAAGEQDVLACVELLVLDEAASRRGADRLLDLVLAEVRRLEPHLAAYDGWRRDKAKRLLGRLYGLSMAGKDRPERHAGLLARAKVNPRRDTSHHKSTVRAVLSLADIEVPRQTVHEWSTVLTALDLEGVARSEVAVVAWLDEKVEVGGRFISGVLRARETVSASQVIRDGRVSAQRAREDQQEATFSSKVKAAETELVGTIRFSDHLDEAPDGLWVSLNRGGAVLSRVKVDGKALQRLIIEHG